jgi:hypothetical protein
VPTQGGTVAFTTDGQSLPGNIELDENSPITATFKNKSAMVGTINANSKGKEMSLTLDDSNTWGMSLRCPT